VTRTSGGIGGTPGTYPYKHQFSSSGSGQGAVFTIVKDGSSQERTLFLDIKIEHR
jgi:hypothetical protein